MYNINTHEINLKKKTAYLITKLSQNWNKIILNNFVLRIKWNKQNEQKN